MVALHLGAWITLAMIWWGDGQLRFGGWTILDWTHFVIIIGCIQTLFARLFTVLRLIRPASEAR
jgi:hypothetical protein